MSRNEKFLNDLKDAGVFVRDYDPGCEERLTEAANKLHRELCKLDLSNKRTWQELTVFEFVDAYARHQGLSRMGGKP